MTIQSYGYAGDIDAAAFSKLIQRVGQSEYGVESIDDWAVAPAAGTRTVSITAGNGWGKGVFDKSSSTESLMFPSQPTGIRYDMVVMRRTWATGVSVFARVAGGSTLAVPPRAISSGDAVDEQPLALVKVTAGSSAVQVVADLRVIADASGCIALHDLVRQYMNRPATMLTIGTTRWQRVYDSNDNLYWLKNDDDTDWKSTGIAVDDATGWDVDWYWLRKQGSLITGEIAMTRTGATITANSEGNVTDGLVLTMPGGWRNGAPMDRQLEGTRPGSTAWKLRAENGNGRIYLTGGVPNADIPHGATLRIRIDYTTD